MIWESAKLNDVLEIKYGKDHKHLKDGNIPVYGSGGIMRYADKYLYDKESILIPRKGTLSNLFYINIPFWSVDTIFYTIIKEGNIAKYLYYFIKSIDLTNLNVGSAVPSLSTEVLNKIEVSLPPLESQKRIASILSTYDDLIENNLKRIKLLEETAQNIYKEWFVNFRFPNYEHTEFDAESGLPVGWEMKKLSELYNTSSGGTPKRDNPNYYEGSIKWFRTNELQDNFLIDSELHISEDALKNSSAKLFPKNTVLMAMYGATIGRLGSLTEEASTNQACCGIIPISEDFGNSYIYYWLLKNREHILSLRMGAAQENISQTIIKDLDVMKPDLNIIKEFNSKIDKINELKINLTVQNQKLKEARDILLPRLMNRTIAV